MVGGQREDFITPLEGLRGTLVAADLVQVANPGLQGGISARAPSKFITDGKTPSKLITGQSMERGFPSPIRGTPGDLGCG
jgi:hypothetical protein